MNANWHHRCSQWIVVSFVGLILSGNAIFGTDKVTFGVVEAGPVESGPVESGPVEAGPVESGSVDSGPVESGPVDSGSEEIEPEKIEATPPKDQHYVGKNTCAACHYSKYRVWRHEKHALGFEKLPKKYRKDPKCLICHTTGYGEPTGYKDASTPQLAGITCESCHGPGSEHAKLAQKLFLGAETEVTLEAENKIRDSISLFLEKHTVESEEAEKLARSSIFRIHPGNACVKCHTTMAHRAHLDYDKE